METFVERKFIIFSLIFTDIFSFFSVTFDDVAVDDGDDDDPIYLVGLGILIRGIDISLSPKMLIMITIREII